MSDPEEFTWWAQESLELVTLQGTRPSRLAARLRVAWLVVTCLALISGASAVASFYVRGYFLPPSAAVLAVLLSMSLVATLWRFEGRPRSTLGSFATDAVEPELDVIELREADLPDDDVSW